MPNDIFFFLFSFLKVAVNITSFKNSVSIWPLHRNTTKMYMLGLKKCLCCLKCLLLLQRTGIPFPAPRSGCSQAPVTPASRDLTWALALLVLCTGAYIPTQTHNLKNKSKKCTRSFVIMQTFLSIRMPPYPHPLVLFQWIWCPALHSAKMQI